VHDERTVVQTEAGEKGIIQGKAAMRGEVGDAAGAEETEHTVDGGAERRGDAVERGDGEGLGAGAGKAGTGDDGDAGAEGGLGLLPKGCGRRHGDGKPDAAGENGLREVMQRTGGHDNQRAIVHVERYEQELVQT
jgi:hypothetical protein